MHPTPWRICLGDFYRSELILHAVATPYISSNAATQSLCERTNPVGQFLGPPELEWPFSASFARNRPRSTRTDMHTTPLRRWQAARPGDKGDDCQLYAPRWPPSLAQGCRELPRYFRRPLHPSCGEKAEAPALDIYPVHTIDRPQHYDVYWKQQ